jgi:hypothetical protein
LPTTKVFIEAKPRSYERLDQFARETTAAEVVTKNSELIDAMTDIQQLSPTATLLPDGQ